MAPGRAVGDATWRAQVRAFLAATSGLVSIEADWDIEKCYENVDHVLFLELALRSGYPGPVVYACG